MRYLALVLCAAGHNLEFQRQVAIPIVPKLSSVLLTIAEKHSDRDVKVVPRILTETTCSSLLVLIHTNTGTIGTDISFAT